MKKITRRRLTAEIITVTLLIVCLAVTSAALAYVSVSVEEHVFQTGKVDINLNGGKPVIEAGEILFAPGVFVEKTFFIENRSTAEVYYRLYLEDISGRLSSYIEVTLKDGSEVLFTGLAQELTKDPAVFSPALLKMNETKHLQITFYLPENTGNQGQNTYLSFTLCADAVQAKNNPEKLFD